MLIHASSAHATSTTVGVGVTFVSPASIKNEEVVVSDDQPYQEQTTDGDLVVIFE